MVRRTRGLLENFQFVGDQSKPTVTHENSGRRRKEIISIETNIGLLLSLKVVRFR